MAKYHLTTHDVLVGLRYAVPADRWEEALGAATEACVMYDRYQGVDGEETIARYGADV